MADIVSSPTPSSTPASATPAVAATPSSPQAAQGAPAQNGQPVQAKAPEAPKQPTAAEIRRLKLKLDGQDIELPEEDVIKLAQQSGAAQKRFQEAAAARKQAEEVVNFLKNNPKLALEKLGVDIRKFSEETLTEIIKREQESPEAKKMREQDEKLRQYEAREKEAADIKAAEEQKRQEAAKKAKDAEEVEAHVKRFDALFTEALSKADCPKNSYTLSRMAHWMSVASRSGQTATTDQLAQMVKSDYDSDAKSRVFAHKNAKGELDGDKIMEFLGDDGMKAIRKAMLGKLKNAKPSFSEPVRPSDTAPVPQNRASWREFAKKSRRALT